MKNIPASRLLLGLCIFVLGSCTGTKPGKEGNAVVKEARNGVPEQQTPSWSAGPPAAAASGQESGLVAPGAKPQLISGQFAFTEGPAVDRKGNIFFTDQPNDKIWKYSVDGQLTVFMDKTGRANGMYFDKKGNLLTCSDENNQLWSISPAGKITVLLEDFQGKRFNGPNDLWVHPKNGGIYFTDPYYQRSYWTRKSPEISGQKVYYLAKGKKEAMVADEQLRQPNGIIGTPDGRFLYVADIGDNKTYKYRIAADGTLSDRQLFIGQGSDGMTLDERGNLYLTGKGGITVCNPAGRLIQQITIPEGWTANVCFGGKDHRTLFITASKAVYTLPMQVKGAR